MAAAVPTSATPPCKESTEYDNPLEYELQFDAGVDCFSDGMVAGVGQANNNDVNNNNNTAATTTTTTKNTRPTKGKRKTTGTRRSLPGDAANVTTVNVVTTETTELAMAKLNIGLPSSDTQTRAAGGSSNHRTSRQRDSIGTPSDRSFLQSGGREGDFEAIVTNGINAFPPAPEALDVSTPFRMLSESEDLWDVPAMGYKLFPVLPCVAGEVEVGRKVQPVVPVRVKKTQLPMHKSAPLTTTHNAKMNNSIGSMMQIMSKRKKEEVIRAQRSTSPDVTTLGALLTGGTAALSPIQQILTNDSPQHPKTTQLLETVRANHAPPLLPPLKNEPNGDASEEGFGALQNSLNLVVSWGLERHGSLEESWKHAASFLAHYKAHDAVMVSNPVVLAVLREGIHASTALKQPCMPRALLAAVGLDYILSATLMIFPFLEELVIKTRSLVFSSIFFTKLDDSGSTSVPNGGCPRLSKQLPQNARDIQALSAKFANRKTYFQACRMLSQSISDKESYIDVANVIQTKMEGSLEYVIRYWKGQVLGLCFRGWKKSLKGDTEVVRLNETIEILRERLMEAQAEVQLMATKERKSAMHAKLTESTLNIQIDHQITTLISERAERAKLKAQLHDLKARHTEEKLNHDERDTKSVDKQRRLETALEHFKTKQLLENFEIENRSKVLDYVEESLTLFDNKTEKKTESFLLGWLNRVIETSPFYKPVKRVLSFNEGALVFDSYWMLLNRLSPRHFENDQLEVFFEARPSAAHQAHLLLKTLEEMGVHLVLPAAGLLEEDTCYHYHELFIGTLFVRFCGWNTSGVAFGPPSAELLRTDNNTDITKLFGEEAGESKDVKGIWDRAATCVHKHIWEKVAHNVELEEATSKLNSNWVRVGEDGKKIAVKTPEMLATAAEVFKKYRERLRTVFHYYAEGEDIACRTDKELALAGLRTKDLSGLTSLSVLRLLREARVISRTHFSLNHIEKCIGFSSYFDTTSVRGVLLRNGERIIKIDEFLSILVALACINNEHPNRSVDDPALAEVPSEEEQKSCSLLTENGKIRSQNLEGIVARIVKRCTPVCAHGEKAQLAQQFKSTYIYTPSVRAVLAQHDTTVQMVFDSYTSAKVSKVVLAKKFHECVSDMELIGEGKGMVCVADVDAVLEAVLSREELYAKVKGTEAGLLYHEFGEALCVLSHYVDSSPLVAPSAKILSLISQSVVPVISKRLRSGSKVDTNGDSE